MTAQTQTISTPTNYLETTTSYTADLDILGEIHAHLLDTLDSHSQNPNPADGPLLIQKNATEERHLRVYINDRQALADFQSGYFVGFIGEKKENITAKTLEEIGKIDAILTGELPRHPFILAYVSYEQPDRYNFANLVLLKNLDSLGQWKDSPFHRAAARELSPSFYQKARIHVGSLENLREPTFTFMRTSHYNFDQGETRMASRIMH